jgi:hypothetical protein
MLVVVRRRAQAAIRVLEVGMAFVWVILTGLATSACKYIYRFFCLQWLQKIGGRLVSVYIAPPLRRLSIVVLRVHLEALAYNFRAAARRWPDRFPINPDAVHEPHKAVKH